jgi:hypothetical protein
MLIAVPPLKASGLTAAATPTLSAFAVGGGHPNKNNATHAANCMRSGCFNMV